MDADPAAAPEGFLVTADDGTKLHFHDWGGGSEAGGDAALVAVGLDDFGQLILDQRHHLRLVAEDCPQFADPLHQIGVLGADFVGLERGQALQAHVEDRLRLLALRADRRVGRCGSRADNEDRREGDESSYEQ